MFELAVLDLKEAEAESEALQLDFKLPSSSPNGGGSGDDDVSGKSKMEVMKDKWRKAIKSASTNLDKAMVLATNATDLSSRLDTRVSMLRDEIVSKKEELGIL